MNKNFSEYVTSTAFNLNLSKPQVRYLVLKDFDRHWLLSTSIATGNALERKGLINNKMLTKEGKLVIGLIKSTGLYDQVVEEFKDDLAFSVATKNTFNIKSVS